MVLHKLIGLDVPIIPEDTGCFGNIDVNIGVFGSGFDDLIGFAVIEILLHGEDHAMEKETVQLSLELVLFDFLNEVTKPAVKLIGDNKIVVIFKNGIHPLLDSMLDFLNQLRLSSHWEILLNDLIEELAIVFDFHVHYLGIQETARMQVEFLRFENLDLFGQVEDRADIR